MAGLQDGRFGCVRFDDPHQHSTGWASVNGDKAIRVSGTEELSSDVTWLLNLSRDMMFRSGFTAHARFRQSEYLSIKFMSDVAPIEKTKVFEGRAYDVLGLLGIDAKDWRRQSEIMSLIFARVMRAANHFLGLSETPIYSLDYGIRAAAGPHDPILDRRLVNAMEEATIHYVRCELDFDVFDAGLNRVTVALPKVQHAISLLSMPLPMGTWKEIRKAKLPKKSEEVAEWVKTVPGPGLFRITVNKMEGYLSKLINYGSGGLSKRQWVCTDEMVWLAAVGDITVHQAFVCDGYAANPFAESVAANLDANFEPSLSMGILMENLWLGVGRRQPPPPHILKDGYSTNPSLPYFKAADRLHCITAGIGLMQDGVTVHSYGKGKITFLTDLDDSGVAQLCQKHGLIPMAMNSKPEGISYDLANPSDILQSLLVQGDIDTLLAVDGAIIDEICN